MSRKLQFPVSLLIGVAIVLFAGANTVLARGGGGGGGGGHGGGGGGHGGGGFGGGGFGGGGFHSGGSFGGSGVHSFSGYGGGNAIHSFSGYQMHSPGASAWRGGVGAGTFAGHSAGINSGAWRHTQAWNSWGHGGAWDHGRGFDRDHFHNFVGYWPFFPGWYGGFGWPYYAYGYGPYYDYGYGDYASSPADYGAGYGGYGSTISYATPSVAYDTPSEATAEDGSTQPSQEYFAQAREVFQSGEYQNALHLAGHAAVEAPRNPEVHELASLALFALKDYRGAAMEAHASLTFGPPIDWPTLYSYYENVDTYTNQLRALEKFVRDQPKAPEGHFLLGYHFIMTGNKEAAKKELQEAISLAPRDKLAQEMLKHL